MAGASCASACVQEEELLVELGSDQTSCHNPFGGGYFPVQLSFDEAQVGGCLFLLVALLSAIVLKSV